MNRLRRLFLLCVLFISFSSGLAQAQRTLGVVWDFPENDRQAIQELQQFRTAGISILFLEQIPPRAIWAEIEKQNMKVFGGLGIHFPIAYTFALGNSSLKKRMQNKAVAFLKHPSVTAIELFQYGALQHPRFGSATASFFKTFDNISPTKLLVTDSRIVPESSLPASSLLYDLHLNPSNVSSLTIPDSDAIGGYRYSPNKKLGPLLTPLKTVLEKTNDQPQKPFFLNSHWLLSQTKKHPQLKSILRSLSSESEPIFPLPNETLPSQSQSSLPIIILLSVWGLLAYHYNISPLYRKSLFRYFTGHKFFLDDIRLRHIRSAFPALMIMFQNALLMVAIAFALLMNFWSGLGLKSLIYHFPTPFFLTGGWYDIAILIFGLILAVYLISILWISFFHKSIQSITQTMNLYAWPMQINFVIGTLAIAIHISGGNMYISALLAGFMLVVLLTCFIAAAFDAAHFLKAGRFRYIGLTVGIYALLLIAVLVWTLAFNDPFWQVIDLSLQLK